MKELAYIRFLNMIASFENMNRKDRLDFLEERLLNHIALQTLKTNICW